MRQNQRAPALLVLLTLLGCSLHSAIPESATKVLRKEFGGPGNLVAPRAMARTSDAIYVAGLGGTDPEEPPHWGLWKLDLNGNLLAQRIGDQEGELWGITTDGSSVYATGFLGWPLGTLFLVAFDLQGNVRWSREWRPRVAPTLSMGGGVCVSGDYIYVVGSAIYPEWERGGDVVVLKYSKSGNLIWERSWGGGGDDGGISIVAYQDRLYIVGWTTGPVYPGNFDGLVLVWSEDGNELAHYIWGGPGYEAFVDVDVGTDLYIAGITSTYGAGLHDVVVLKMDLSGNLIWYKTYGGSGHDEASALDLDGDRVHVCAEQNQSPVYLQYKTDGNLIGAWGDEVDRWTAVSSSDDLTYLIGYARTGPDRVVGVLTGFMTTYNLTVNTPGGDYWASVDGIRKTGASSRFEVTSAEHILEVAPQVVEGRTKFIFSHWSDGSTENPRTIRLTRDTEITAIYEVMDVFLEVLTDYSSATGSGWVPVGTMVTVGMEQTIVDQGNGTRRVFSGWLRDGTPFSQMSNTTIEVTTPMVLVACWSTEYQVQVFTDRGTALGGGWYLLGSTATVSVSPTTIEKDLFNNYVFEGWRTDAAVVSTLATYSLTVTRPANLTASWKTELNLWTVGGAGAGVLLAAVLALVLARRSRPPPPPPSA